MHLPAPIGCIILLASSIAAFMFINWIAGVTTFIFVFLVWTFNTFLSNKRKGKKIGHYLKSISSDFTGDENQLQFSGDFFLSGDTCNGFVFFDSLGVHIAITSPLTIEWKHIKTIKIIKLRGFTVAQLFLLDNSNVKKRLFIPWSDVFIDLIPQDIILIDSR